MEVFLKKQLLAADRHFKVSVVIRRVTEIAYRPEADIWVLHGLQNSSFLQERQEIKERPGTRL
jgi:hypothetical protein